MKKLISIIIIMFIIASMVGCGARPVSDDMVADDGRYVTPVDISRQENLVYDVETKIVYISQSTYYDHPVYTPYFSENGLLYRFVNGDLVEVGN